MKVSNSVQSVGNLAGSGAPAKPAKAQASAPAAGGDQVELSPLSARLQEIAGEMAATPAVDAGRVAEIKQAIAEGRFQINPEGIASGLLDSVREMLAAHR